MPKKKSVKGVSLDTPFTSEYTQSHIAHIPGIFNSTKNLINVLRHFLYVTLMFSSFGATVGSRLQLPYPLLHGGQFLTEIPDDGFPEREMG